MSDYNSANDNGDGDGDGESYKNEETLRRLYWAEEMTTYEIADRFDISQTTVLDWMERHGIPRRDGSPLRKEGLNENALRRLYFDEGLGLGDIADRKGCGISTVHRRFEEYGIERRTIPEVNKRAAASKPAPFDMNGCGYERWRVYCDGKRHQILHHRLLAVSEFGFDAVCDMDVHHLNEIPWDNRPANIQLMTHGEHSSYHNTKWVKEGSSSS